MKILLVSLLVLFMLYAFWTYLTEIPERVKDD